MDQADHLLQRKTAVLDRMFCSGTWALLLVVLVSIASFVNTCSNGFVFDDIQNIVQNRWIRDPRFLPEIFGSHVAAFDPQFATSYYRPLMHVSYMLVYHMVGLVPAGFHLLNILLHSAISVLAYVVARQLLERDSSSRDKAFVSIMAALFFATHPVHTEAVAWLAGITDLSFTLWLLLAFVCYLKAENAETLACRAMSALFFLAALLSKEPAMMLLPLIVIYEFAFRKPGCLKDLRTLAKRLAPLAGSAALYLSLRVWALGGFAPGRSHHHYTIITSVLSAFHLFAQYLCTLLLPVNLNALYLFRPVDSLFDWRAITGLVACLGFLSAAWILRCRSVLIMAFSFIVLPLLPALYIPALGESVLAERYLYLPTLGFAILLAVGLQEVRARIPKASKVIVCFALLVLFAYSAGSVTRSRAWKNSLTLWTDTVRKSPDSAAAYEGLCYAQYNAGRPRDALQTCRRALELDPERIDARTNLATTLSMLGDLDGAIREFQEVLRRRPNSAEAHTNLGLVYMAKGLPDLAVDSYRRALRCNPYYAEAHNDLGVALARAGRRDEAIGEISEAVRLAPDNAEYATNLQVVKSTRTAPSIYHAEPSLLTSH